MIYRYTSSIIRLRSQKFWTNVISTVPLYQGWYVSYICHICLYRCGVSCELCGLTTNGWVDGGKKVQKGALRRVCAYSSRFPFIFFFFAIVRDIRQWCASSMSFNVDHSPFALFLFLFPWFSPFGECLWVINVEDHAANSACCRTTNAIVITYYKYVDYV